MPIFSSSPEEKAAKAEAAQQKKADAARAAFDASPPGQARLASQRGDVVFQLQLELGTQRAHIFPDRSRPTSLGPGYGADVSQDLNAVCAEGWDLITGSVTFVPTGSNTQNKFTGGEHTSMSGELIGHYLFRRGTRRAAPDGQTSPLEYRPAGGP